jgi:2-C-methyl-D-erythritol 4-phosphate cytidylyltransferase
VVVVPGEDVRAPPDWLRLMPVARVAGGARRSDSVRHGLAALAARTGTVLVHDAARPLVSRDLIDRVLAAAGQGAVVPGLRVTDTLKEVDDAGRVRNTPDRDRFWRAQTPQAFPLETLRRVHDRALADGIRVTDDAALFEHYDLPVHVIVGEADNLKITTPADLAVAETLARRLPDPT